MRRHIPVIPDPRAFQTPRREPDSLAFSGKHVNRPMRTVVPLCTTGRKGSLTGCEVPAYGVVALRFYRSGTGRKSFGNYGAEVGAANPCLG